MVDNVQKQQFFTQQTSPRGLAGTVNPNYTSGPFTSMGVSGSSDIINQGNALTQAVRTRAFNELKRIEEEKRAKQSQPQEQAQPDQQQNQQNDLQKQEEERRRQEEAMQRAAEQQKTVEQVMAESGQQEQVDQLREQGRDQELQQQAMERVQQQMQSQQQAVSQGQVQEKALAGDYTITGRANRSYSDSNQINVGTDLAAAKGTKVALPGDAEWEVVESVNNITKRTPGDFSAKANYGWGNSIVVKNTQTGEKIRYSHLDAGSVPDLQPGQKLQGGSVVGGVGNTGNTRGKTGYHLDIEYYDPSGSRGDILNSPYRSYF